MTLYLAFGTIVTLAIFSRAPQLAILILFFVNFLHLSSIVDQSSAPLWAALKSLGPGLALVVLYRWFFTAERPTHVVPTLIIMTGYVLWLATSLLHARASHLALRELELDVRYMALALVAAALIRDMEDFRHAIWGCLLGALVIGLIGVNTYGGQPFGELFGELGRTTRAHIAGDVRDHRFEGPMGANELGALFVLTLPLALERFLNGRWPPAKMTALAALVLSLIGIYLTASRGALVALMSVLLAGAWLYRGKVGWLLLVAGMLLLMTMVLPEEYVARALSIVGVFQGSSDGSIEQRRDLLLVGWELFADHPIFGVGLGGYDWHVREYTQVLGMADPGIDMSAHNTYVEVATEQGLAGLLLYLGMVGYAGLGLINAVQASDSKGAMRTPTSSSVTP